MFYKEDKVNMLIELLKRYNINQYVLCPGSRNAIIVNNISIGGCFAFCHSVTDERSAGFFALGLAQKAKASAIVVTSGSALLNVAPAVVEAYYQKVPLIVISADRPQEDIDQNVGQTMRQYGALDNYVARSVNLTDAMGDNAYYHNRLINEALTSAMTSSRPVHINVPLPSPAECAQSVSLPEVVFNKVKMIESRYEEDELWIFLCHMFEAKRPMIIIGQDNNLHNLQEDLDTVKENVVVLSEPLSDEHARPYAGFIDTMPDSMLPDFIVYMGGTTVCRSINKRFSSIPNLTVWRVDKDGEFSSPFRRIDGLICCTPCDFITELSRYISSHNPKIPKAFYEEWQNAFDCEEQRLQSIDDTNLTAASTVKYFEEQLEDMEYDYHVHYGNSTAVRLACQYAYGHKIWCNRGVNGIDGSLSTAAGFSACCSPDEMVFCVLGDLSFFYDQNALWNSNIKGNLRIIILNDNHGGIFDKVKGLEKCYKRDRFVAGRHSADARGICTQNDIGYLSAKTVDEMHLGIVTLLTAESERPMVLEVILKD
ncbi:MAG: 2-succinyl-5-enolpyruvyl-6-hydroxy-3-cyclohexene-1-carboxylic-acid synthase [Prevotella sp.]